MEEPLQGSKDRGRRGAAGPPPQLRTAGMVRVPHVGCEADGPGANAFFGFSRRILGLRYKIAMQNLILTNGNSQLMGTFLEAALR
jgi:hypothetical protein